MPPPPEPAQNEEPQPGARRLLSHVSGMMALQWGSLGVWVVTLPTYLGANTGEEGAGVFGASFVGTASSTAAIGALIAPALFGLVADRWINIERLVALLHVVCASVLAALSVAESQTVFYVLLLLYFHAYTPTGALLSSLALRQLPDASRQFAVARAAGTGGWVLAGWLIGFVWPALWGESIESTVLPMRIGVAVHLAAAAYSLTLPATPPSPSKAGRPRLTASGPLLGRPAVVLFLIVCVVAAAPLRMYEGFVNLFLNESGFEHAAGWQTLGQISEVGVMLSIPLLVARFRLKSMLLFGAGAWVARFALLAFSGGAEHPWMVFLAVALHGPCFTLVFILAQLHIDRLAPRSARSSAQGLLALAMFGAGGLLGAFVSQWGQAVWLTPQGVTPPPYDWFSFWLAPCAVSAAALVLYVIAFHETAHQTAEDESQDAEAREAESAELPA